MKIGDDTETMVQEALRIDLDANITDHLHTHIHASRVMFKDGVPRATSSEVPLPWRGVPYRAGLPPQGGGIPKDLDIPDNYGASSLDIELSKTLNPAGITPWLVLEDNMFSYRRSQY